MTPTGRFSHSGVKKNMDVSTKSSQVAPRDLLLPSLGKGCADKTIISTLYLLPFQIFGDAFLQGIANHIQLVLFIRRFCVAFHRRRFDDCFAKRHHGIRDLCLFFEGTRNKNGRRKTFPALFFLCFFFVFTLLLLFYGNVKKRPRNQWVLGWFAK